MKNSRIFCHVETLVYPDDSYEDEITDTECCKTLMKCGFCCKEGDAEDGNSIPDKSDICCCWDDNILHACSKIQVELKVLTFIFGALIFPIS